MQEHQEDQRSLLRQDLISQNLVTISAQRSRRLVYISFPRKYDHHMHAYAPRMINLEESSKQTRLQMARRYFWRAVAVISRRRASERGGIDRRATVSDRYSDTSSVIEVGNPLARRSTHSAATVRISRYENSVLYDSMTSH
jgi:hypothetical protein